MKDTRTLAFINLHAMLGTIVQLCELVPEARKLADVKPLTVGFAVKDGPEAALIFDHGTVTLRPTANPCQILLPFASPEKFNGLIDGTVTPIPRKGFTHLSFLTKNFIGLTGILESYLRPDPEKLKDEEFYRISTTLMLHLIGSAVAQIGNEDVVGRASASYIPDGVAKLAIGEEIAIGIEAKDHRLTVLHRDLPAAHATMRFDNLHLARDLFDGKVNSLAAVGMGQIRISGMIPMIDNINRILDRVALYLA